MITIPEYIFRDGSIEFKCPALEMSRDGAVQMHAVLADTRWLSVLYEQGYICHAMGYLGFDSDLIAITLCAKYSCGTLEGCIDIGGIDIDAESDWQTHVNIANVIRRAWCDHMRTHLSTILSQG